MATRNERVVLSLDDRFTPGMARAAAATALLNRELNSLDRNSVQASRSSNAFVRDVQAQGRAAAGTEKQIDKLSGRMRILAEVGATVAPALAPIGGVAIAGVAGLASQLGFAAVAGGVLIGSMQGLGDALSAMNKADLDPTAENLAKAEDALNRLAPAARDFAREANALAPALRTIRDMGADELFPGLSDSLNSLERLGPKFGDIFAAVGGALGEIASDSAASFASDRWAGFFDFIQDEAPRATKELATTLGDLTHGLGELWMAFTPLNNDFSGWMMDVADGFDEWATGLDQTQGFQEFVDYIRTTGPQVADTLSALGDALVQIVQATAPLGGPVLAAIEGFAKAVGAIADSDIGTPIFAGVAALALLNRTLAVTASLSKVSLSSGLFAGLGTVGAGAKTGLASLRSDIGAVSDKMVVFGANTEKASAAAGRLKGQAGTFGKSAALMGGLAIASTGAADGVGLTNTTSLALMGTMAGPFGVAIGGGVGLLLDIAAAGKNAAAETAAFEESLKSMTVAQLGALRAEEERKAADKAPVPAAGGTAAMRAGAGDREKIAAIDAQTTATKKLEEAKAAETLAERRSAIAFAERIGLNLDVSNSAEMSAKAIKEQAKAFQQLKEETREAGRATARSFNLMGDSANDAKVSLGEWLAQQEKITRALSKFNDNSLKAAREGLDKGLIASLREMGPEGALRMDQLANGTEDGIRRANKSWRAMQAEIKRTADITLDLANLSPVKMKITADEIAAMTAIERVRTALAGLKDKTVNVRVTRTGVSTTSDFGPQITPADGITVPGQRYPYGDKIHAYLAPGEEVISNRHGQADRHRSLLKRINANAMADGGTAGDKKKRKKSFDEDPGGESEAQRAAREAQEAREAARAENRANAEAQVRSAAEEAAALAAAAEEARKEHESKMFLAAIEGQERAAQGMLEAAGAHKAAAESVRDGWSQAMTRAGSAATAGFQSSLFGSQGSGLRSGPGGASGSSWKDALKGDIAGLQERGGLVQQLAGQGITGKALEELLSQGSNAQIQDLLASGGAGEFAAMFAQREALTASVSGQVGQAAYGTEFAAASAAVATLGDTVLNLQKELAAISAQRPITVYEAYSAQATAAEIARLQAIYGAA